MFSAEGAAVVILDINTTAGQPLVDSLTSDGRSAQFVECDMADVERVESAGAEASEALGGIDVVFANAAVGTVVVGGTVESIELERWELAFDVNARGVYALCRAALPHLRSA